MADDAGALVDLATAISDGTPIDWQSVRSSHVTEADRSLLRHLHVIADIVSLQQRLASQPAHASVIDELRRAPAGVQDAREALPSWGPLRLIGLLGQGAFGEVYRAWDPRLDREVALKLLRRRDSRRAAGSALIDEGRLLAKVRHPNVITVYGAERIGDHVGIWMELIDGPTLGQVVADGGPLAPDEVARIGRELCAALAAVHHAGLLHRDIKAQNVMRDTNGRIVLMDFGAGREDQAALARAHDVAGTPLYLAPEIFEGNGASVQSDLYSLGVLLYHLATGAFPTHAATYGGIREAHRRRECRLLADARPDLPRALAGIIDRALSPDPAARFESADEMGRLFEAPSSGRFRNAGWYAAAALVIIGVAGTVVLTRAARSTTPDRAFKTVTGDAAVTVRRFGQPGDVAVDGIPSADGRYLPYTESNAGNLTLLDLTTGAKRQLTHFTSFAGSGGAIDAPPTISRDNSRVAYAWTTEHGSELRVVNSDGSNARTLTRDAEGRRWWGVEPFEWTRDGRFVLVAIHLKDGTHAIALVSTGDGSTRVLKTTGQVASRVSLSPDGRYVAYDAAPDPSVDVHDIYVLASDGSFDSRIVDDPANDTAPVWTPDGGGILFISDRTGTSGVWHVPVDRDHASAPPALVNRDMGQVVPVGITEGGTFFYLRRTGMVDVYTGELEPVSGRLRGTTAAASRGFVGSNISPDWSPDGRFLAYVSQRGTGIVGPRSRVLVIRSLADGQERTISPPLRFYIAPRWATDGRSIYLKGLTSSDEFALLRIDAASGAVLWSWRGPGATFFPGELSRDGRSYLATENGRIVEIDLESGRAAAVPLPASAGKPLYVALSPDQRSIGFSTVATANETVVAVVSRQGGDPRVLVRATRPEFVSVQAWARDGTSLLFAKTRSVNGQNDGPADLWRVHVADGRVEPVGVSMVGLREVRVHPDGGRIAFSAGWPTLELWVMENFLAALPPRTR